MDIAKPNLSAVHRATGLSMAHLSKVFNGHRSPSFRTANMLATHMKVSLDDLYGMLAEKRAEMKHLRGTSGGVSNGKGSGNHANRGRQVRRAVRSGRSGGRSSVGVGASIGPRG